MSRPSAFTDRAIILALWLAVSAALLIATWPYIGPMALRDPDDALRLVQVRDLLAGQGWFDLTQRRIHPPEGVPMHWSRLVDLPIALQLGLLGPLIGADAAERVAMIATPLLLLLALCFIVHAIARAIGLGRGTALVAVAVLLSSLSILVQFQPMRIDHHGWQIVMAALAVLALVRTDRRDGRIGLLAGLAAAVWMQISAEGVPYAVAIGAVLGLRHVVRDDRWADLRAYLVALSGASAALLFATRAPADALTPWCDSLSPAYLAPLGIVTIALLVGHRLLPDRTAIARALPPALAGAAGVAGFLLLSRQCLAGPFDTLDPLVYRLWYQSVMEGMPIGAQKPDLQALILVPALLGLAGGVIAIRRATDERGREAWTGLLILQIVAFAIALDVMRAMSVAHLVVLPGNAVLLVTLIREAQRLRFMPLRVGLTAATVVATPFGAASVATATLHRERAAAPADESPKQSRCKTRAVLGALDTLPRVTLFTPIDVGAHMLAFTHHDVVATGHHRNLAGMKAVVAGYIAAPDAARAIVTGTGAAYVVFCAGENEVEKYRRLYPHGLMAMLAAGHHPAWLAPVPKQGEPSMRVYRIVAERDRASHISASTADALARRPGD